MSDQRTTIYRGRVVNLGLEEARLPDGRRFPVEVIRHPGGAAVAAVDAQNRVCLIRQYRHAAGGWLWELPAGKIDPGEAPLGTARRELAEEAGVGAEDWHALGEVVMAPGYSDEVIYLFLAQELSPAAVDHQADELIEIHWLPLDTAVQRALSGELQDAKSVIGLLRAAEYLGRN